MKELFVDFENDVIERMSRVYYDELLYFSTVIPQPLINFNDVLLLKKGQKYISHTNTLFQKSIATLFCHLNKQIGPHATICITDGGKGRGVYTKEAKQRLHFLGQEKFVNFPRVNWLNFKESSDSCTDVYAIMVEKNAIGTQFVDKANSVLKEANIHSKCFFLLEDYVISRFGVNVWYELHASLKQIERKVKNYQWFGLINFYNRLTQDDFIEKVKLTLATFDYETRLTKMPNPIERHDFSIMKRNFISGRYNLLLGDEDFCRSFITSEWLFENLNNNDLLEKTFIITGYIKSIEQLLAYVIKKTADTNSQILVQSGGGLVTVDVTTEEFYKATLGNMMYYLKHYENRKIYSTEITREAIKKMVSIIREWINNERNGYFHKDNIQSVERVAEIREKTFDLYFLVLSTMKAI